MERAHSGEVGGDAFAVSLLKLLDECLNIGGNHFLCRVLLLLRFLRVVGGRGSGGHGEAALLLQQGHTCRCLILGKMLDDPEQFGFF